MINLRKYKYVVIADGEIETEKANVIACEDLYQAQDAFKQAIEKQLDPMMFEMSKYIEDSLCDRYAYPGELAQAWGMTKQDKTDVIKDLVNKIKSKQV